MGGSEKRMRKERKDDGRNERIERKKEQKEDRSKERKEDRSIRLNVNVQLCTVVTKRIL